LTARAPGRYNGIVRVKLIACEVFARELMLASATSPHVIELKLMPFGLHDVPENLRTAIQTEIDSTEEGRFDYIALGYGLCSRGTAGLRAGSIPLVIPRAHDCITMLLGSRSRYNAEFSQHPGTYYYSPGWIERKDGEVEQGFIDDKHGQRTEDRYREYVDKYGEENAKFLIEQESQWQANYTRAALIDMGIGGIESYRRFTRDLAAERGWEYAEIEGDMSILRRLANGNWDSSDFLTVHPGRTAAESFEEGILKEG
jgi:hypothetical protein